tara:strand:- start:17002 stop:17646 length:645 start_codon:yes stop_codon:yes gene_type:complete
MKQRSYALLMIDFQNDFCKEGGYGDRCGGLDWVRPVIPRARELLDAARAYGVPVIHTREGYAPDLSDCPPLRVERSEQAGARYGSMGPMGRLMIRGEFGNQIIEELAPIAGEIEYDKPSYGAFATTSIEKDLRRLGVTDLVFAGVTADVCVHTTLREATDRGFNCIYVKDAISTLDPAIRKAAEEMILQEGGIWGQVVESADMIDVWSRSTSGA